MSARQASAAELAAAMQSERAGFEALLEVLRAERQALTDGETDRLADLAPRKRELLLHIAHLGQMRNRLLERCGVTPDRRGMERLLEANAGATTCHTEWRALVEIATEAQRLNQENGAHIDAGMRATQQALAVLTSAAQASSTYSAAGRALNPLASRSLASA